MANSDDLLDYIKRLAEAGPEQGVYDLSNPEHVRIWNSRVYSIWLTEGQAPGL